MRAVLAGLLLVPLLQVGQGLAPGLGAYVVAGTLVGTTLGVTNAAIFALLLTEVGDGDRGKVMALVNGLSRSAGVGALLLGGTLGTQLGPRAAYVVCGAAGLVVALSALLRVRRAVHRSVDPVSTDLSARR